MHAAEDHLRRLDGNARHWILSHLHIADLDQAHGVERKEVTGRGADEDVTVVVGPIGHAADGTSGLEGACDGQLDFDPIEELQEGL